MEYKDKEGNRHVTELYEKDIINCLHNCRACAVGCVFKHATFKPDIRMGGTPTHDFESLLRTVTEKHIYEDTQELVHVEDEEVRQVPQEDDEADVLRTVPTSTPQTVQRPSGEGLLPPGNIDST